MTTRSFCEQLVLRNKILCFCQSVFLHSLKLHHTGLGSIGLAEDLPKRPQGATQTCSRSLNDKETKHAWGLGGTCRLPEAFSSFGHAQSIKSLWHLPSCQSCLCVFGDSEIAHMGFVWLCVYTREFISVSSSSLLLCSVDTTLLESCIRHQWLCVGDTVLQSFDFFYSDKPRRAECLAAMCHALLHPQLGVEQERRGTQPGVLGDIVLWAAKAI